MAALETAGVVLGVMTGALAALGFVWQGLRVGLRLVRGTLRFLDDWNGEDPRPGYSGRPGFPARIASLEERFGVFELDIAEVKKELNPNSGSSLRDAITRIDKEITKGTE
jgi:hypothetical protein